MKYFKKTAAVLCAASLFLCACDTADFEDEIDIEDAQNVFENVDTPENKNSFSKGLSMSLGDNGELNISRKTYSGESMGEGGTWTIFVYLCGSDLESGNGLATMDMDEMLSASTGTGVKFVVQTDGTAAWQSEVVSAENAERYVICNGEA